MPLIWEQGPECTGQEHQLAPPLSLCPGCYPGRARTVQIIAGAGGMLSTPPAAPLSPTPLPTCGSSLHNHPQPLPQTRVATFWAAEDNSPSTHPRPLLPLRFSPLPHPQASLKPSPKQVELCKAGRECHPIEIKRELQM